MNFFAHAFHRENFFVLPSIKSLKNSHGETKNEKQNDFQLTLNEFLTNPKRNLSHIFERNQSQRNCSQLEDSPKVCSKLKIVRESIRYSTSTNTSMALSMSMDVENYLRKITKIIVLEEKKRSKSYKNEDFSK